MAVRMSGGKMRDFMPWSKDIDEEEKKPFTINEETIQNHPELMAEYGIVQRNKSRKVAMIPQKVVDYGKIERKTSKLSKSDRIERLKGK